MASEIRVNSLSSRTGLSTVTFTDTGPIFSGITTFQDNSGFNVGTGGSIFSPASNTVTLGTNNAERLRIASNGNIGIGTDNPTVKLDIVDSGSPNIALRGSSYPSIRYSALDGTTDAEIYYGISGNDLVFNNVNAGPIALKTSNVERLRITSAGLIGIGENNPSTPLHVAGSLTLENSSATGNAWTYYKNADRTWLVGVRGSSNDALSFYDLTTDVERLRILSDGKVAIGGVTANSLLDVHGGDGISITHSGDTFLQSRTTGTTGTNYLEFKDSGGGAGAISYHQ